MDRYARSIMFGHERLTPALGLEFTPIRDDEVDQEVNSYKEYARVFSREEVLKRPVGYAVVPADAKFDFVNIDRWYNRDNGYQVGAYILYRLNPRN